MPGNLASSYTLVIPTFNRSHQLRRLLRYLERQSAPFTVLVLDSSAPDHKKSNAQVVGSVKLRVQRIEYDSELAPFAKFLKGAEAVDTPFLSICADDDVIVLASLGEIVEFLERNEDYSAAHGFYFNFCEDEGAEQAAASAAGGRGAKPETRISSLFYRGPSLADPAPVQRLAQLLRRYEALTYAVYRTSVAREIYAAAQKVDSILARELLAGALTVLAGKTARLKNIYYGRNTRPSVGYENWHPLEWMATDPGGMFKEYLAYRSVLTRALVARSTTPISDDEALRICDLVHLRYLGSYLHPAYLDFALRKNLEKLPPRETIAEVWKFWNGAAKSGWRAWGKKLLPTRVVVSRNNRYRFDPAFLYAGPRREVRVTKREIDAVVGCLDAFSAALA